MHTPPWRTFQILLYFRLVHADIDFSSDHRVFIGLYLNPEITIITVFVLLQSFQCLFGYICSHLAKRSIYLKALMSWQRETGFVLKPLLFYDVSQRDFIAVQSHFYTPGKHWQMRSFFWYTDWNSKKKKKKSLWKLLIYFIFTLLCNRMWNILQCKQWSTKYALYT